MRSSKLERKNFDPTRKLKYEPRGRVGADKNFRPISTSRPNMNEIHQRFFKKI